MEDFNQIIVGAGTSAHTFLYYAYVGALTKRGMQFDPRLGKVLIVGESDLWQRIEQGNPSHKVGQPPHILALPNQWPQPAVGKEFMTVTDLVKKQADLAFAAKAGLNVTTLQGTVLGVAKDGDHYRVKTSTQLNGKNSFTARQVIIATNGPQQKQREEVLAGQPDDTGRGYQRVIDAVTYMNNLQPAVKAVCIHGSSATSAWAVDRASISEVKKIFWVARSNFSEANPAGRNTDIITRAREEGWMIIGNISKIEVKQNFPKGDNFKEHNETVTLTFKGQVLEVKPDGGREPLWKQDVEIDVNQYVYALGATTLARVTNTGGILSENIRLHPVYDVDKRFGDVSDDTVIAFTDDAERLWVVGAAVFRAGGSFLVNGIDVGKKYANVTQMMAKCGHPPEGIAGIVASIAALTGVYEVHNINFATADYKTLERWVQSVYYEMKKREETTLEHDVLPEEIERFVADQIVALRKHTTFSVEHLDAQKGIEEITATVKKMLKSKTSLEQWLPEKLQASWKAPE